jgi:2-amino-4-hydroxy-6-hydroxymethyldihydropteridine diphosphokinase
MTEPARCYVIGLGANVGDRLVALSSARAALGRLGALLRVSSLYETAPVGPPQPDYLNAAVLLETFLSPSALLEQLLSIERAHGRQRLERWGPRTLDLDVLHSPELIVEQLGLTIPHPELCGRAFALLPLLEVLPHARDPRSLIAYSDRARALASQDVRRLQASDGWPSSP